MSAPRKLTVTWDGPLTLDKVITTLGNGGSSPAYSGDDYGLYQIYGTHILGGAGSLLYIGKASKQTFAARFKQHRTWLEREEHPVRIYVGRLSNSKRYEELAPWSAFEEDVCLAESLLIYKYSPHYNARAVSLPPHFEKRGLLLEHNGKRHKLHEIDRAPDDL